MVEKLKDLIPKFLNLVHLAPFLSGVIIGYLFRTPIKLLISLIFSLLKV